jgi:hypothetical protein
MYKQRFIQSQDRVSIFVLWAVIVSSSVCHASDVKNIQHWNSEGIQIKLTTDWAFEIREELRLEDNGGSLYHYFTETGLMYAFRDYLDFSVNYRHIKNKKNEDWATEYRPHINGTMKIRWHEFVIGDRNRIEFRKFEDGNHSWRWRNKLSIQSPFRWTRLKIEPYVSDEVFIDFDKNEFNQNRLYIGWKLTFFKHVRGDLFYMCQSIKSTGWKDNHIIGTNLKVII